ncbi:MAG: LuxR family response regulator, partial [Actinomyces urogenitalis DORA_12]
MTDSAARTTVRLLVVDDHPVVRSGIIGMLSREPDLEVVAEAGDGQEAVVMAQRWRPDVVLMDLRMPVMDGVEATRLITAEADAPKVVVLTTYDTDSDILRAVEAGATGYLVKDSPREDIAGAVRSAVRGYSAMSPAVTTRILAATRRSAAAPSDTAPALSPREREVL